MAYDFTDANNTADMPEVGSDFSPGTGDFTLLARIDADVVTYGATDQGTIWSRNFTALELFIYQATLQVYCGGTSNNPAPLAITTGLHSVGVRRSSGSLQTWLDGSFQTASTNNADASGSGNVQIGTRQGAGTATTAYDGRLQNIGWWPGVALTADEMMSFHRGFPPSRIRPQSLASDLRLIRSTADRRKSRSLSLSGTVPVPFPNLRVYGL